MNFFKHPNPIKALVSFILLGALLFSSTAFSHVYYKAEKPTRADFVQNSHYHFTPHHPVQNQSAESQNDTELKVEEEDSTEKDDSHIAGFILYDFNGSWIAKAACSNRALIRIAGVSDLYVLHHSWKFFLI